jgi:hypothetical protein
MEASKEVQHYSHRTRRPAKTAAAQRTANRAPTRELTMAKLDDLLKMDGVLAAGEFTTNGKMVDFKSN